MVASWAEGQLRAAQAEFRPSPPLRPSLPSGLARPRNLGAAEPWCRGSRGSAGPGRGGSDGGGAAAGPAGLGRAGAAPHPALGVRGVPGARPRCRGHAADAGRRAGGVAGERAWGCGVDGGSLGRERDGAGVSPRVGPSVWVVAAQHVLTKGSCVVWGWCRFPAVPEQRLRWCPVK